MGGINPDWHGIVSVLLFTAIGAGVTWAILRPRLRGEPRLDNQAFIVRVVVPTLAFVIVAVTVALIRGLFDLRSADDPELLKIIGPAFQIIVGGFVGFLGGYAVAMSDAAAKSAAKAADAADAAAASVAAATAPPDPSDPVPTAPATDPVEGQPQT